MREKVYKTAMESRESLIGMTSEGLVNELPILFPQVTHFSFAHYKPKESVGERLHSRTDIKLPSEVLPSTIVTTYFLYAEIAASQALLYGADTSPSAALEEMLEHDNSSESTREFRVEAKALLTEGVRHARSRIVSDDALALSSICILDDSSRAHIPMLDFRVPISSRSQKLVVLAAQKLGLPHAMVLESGRSYHVYGLCLVRRREWSRFLTKALFLNPIVDVRYVAHRLLAGRSVLRISVATAKPKLPEVVATF